MCVCVWEREGSFLQPCAIMLCHCPGRQEMLQLIQNGLHDTNPLLTSLCVPWLHHHPCWWCPVSNHLCVWVCATRLASEPSTACLHTQTHILTGEEREGTFMLLLCLCLCISSAWPLSFTQSNALPNKKSLLLDLWGFWSRNKLRFDFALMIETPHTPTHVIYFFSKSTPSSLTFCVWWVSIDLPAKHIRLVSPTHPSSSCDHPWVLIGSEGEKRLDR